MSRRSSSSSAAPSRLAQSEEPITMPEATSTKSDDETEEAFFEETELLLRDIRTEKWDLKDSKKLLAAMKTYCPEKCPDSESNDERKRWAKARKDFVNKYRQKREQEDYRTLTDDVKERCKKILEKEAILHQEPSSRVKDIKSVEDKVNQQIPGLKRKGDSTDAMDQLYEKIVDLAGVRILVYFPSDVSRVVEAIKKSDEFEIVNSVVSFSRRRVDYRAEDKLKQLKGADLNYTDGPWMEKRLSTDDIIDFHRWKNSGYRAAHLHVRVKEQNVAIIDQDKVQSGIESEKVVRRGDGEFPQLHKPKVKLISKQTKRRRSQKFRSPQS